MLTAPFFSVVIGKIGQFNCFAHLLNLRLKFNRTMQVSFTLVDWQELEALGGTEAFQELRFEAVGHIPWMINGHKVGLKNDSAMFFEDAREAIEDASDAIDTADHGRVSKSILPILTSKASIDDFGLTKESECCYLCANPARLKQLSKDWQAADLPSIAAKAFATVEDDWRVLKDEGETELKKFLEQIRGVLNAGVEKGYGLLIEIG